MQVAESCQRPIGIFWDIENCRVPKNKSATDLVLKIRKNIIKPNGYREFEFFCGCDTTTLPKQICEELNLAGVTIAHVPSSSKNAADEKIKEQMAKFVDTHSSRATVMLISGDVNFAPTMRGFRDRIGAKVLVMHSHAVAQELKNCADELFNFNQFCEDLQPRQMSVENNPVHVKVNNLPKDMTAQSLRRELQMSTQNRGGKVEHLTHDSALIKFPCQRDAERALGGINGNKIGSAVVSAKIASVPANVQKQANNAASKKNKMTQGNATTNPFNMLQMHNTLPMQQNIGANFPWQPNLMGNGLSGFPIQQNSNAANVAAKNTSGPVKENSKTFRLIVGGISGKLSQQEVGQRLLSFLAKKPKSMIVANGNADLEFTYFGAMEEAFSKFNGLIFEGSTLTAHKVFKPRTISDEHKHQHQKAESLNQKWSSIQEQWKKSEKPGSNLNVAFVNQIPMVPVVASVPQGKPPEIKSGRFMRIVLPQTDPVVAAKLQILVKANNGTMIDISNQEAWAEFANQTAAEDAKRVFQSSLSAPGFCLNAETLNIIPPKIYELRKKIKESQKKNADSSAGNTKSEKPQKAEKVQKTEKAQKTEKKAGGGKAQKKEITPSPVENQKPEQIKATFLTISGLSSKLPIEEVRVALSDLFVAFDGSVVNIANGCAYVKFDNGNNAEAASQLFKDNNVTIMDKPIRAQLCTKAPKLAIG